jgi:SAM-dependent methyltransferase
MNQDLSDAAATLCSDLAAIEKDAGSGAPLDSLVDRIRQSMRVSCAACERAEENARSEVELKALRAEFQAQIAPWFLQGWFTRRALTKPRGYPGDFETLEGIYDGRVKTEEGIGWVLDAYFLQSKLAVAVLKRKDKCRGILDTVLGRGEGRNVSILDIACGPCRELRESRSAREFRNYRFCGLDHDQAALDHARDRAVEAGVSSTCLSFIKQNVLRLTSPERNQKNLGRFDFIYSAGLFDYLPDKILANIVQGTISLLAADGEYIAAFKDSARYHKTAYQWHVDWHFLQRTEADCCHLLEAGGGTITGMERDETGIIMFFRMKRG